MPLSRLQRPRKLERFRLDHLVEVARGEPGVVTPPGVPNLHPPATGLDTPDPRLRQALNSGTQIFSL